MKRTEKAPIEYKYTGKLDIRQTMREIIANKNKNGRYMGHSKYMWRALELRNDGYDNREIAEKLYVESGSSLNSSMIRNMFDNYLIESNPDKKGKVKTASDIILDEDFFYQIELESMQVGKVPYCYLLEVYGGKVGDREFKDKRALRRIWEASYEKYLGIESN